MSADPGALNADFLEAVRTHKPSGRVLAQAEAADIDLDALRGSDPLTYAAINAVSLVRTDARLAAQVNLVLERVNSHAQLFTVPLTRSQTDTELRVFPPLQKTELAALDDALGTFVGTQSNGLFYRTVSDLSGEHREFAWPLSESDWQAGAAFVGPFANEGSARAWGQARVDPRSGLVVDTLPYAGAWYCDVFKGN